MTHTTSFSDSPDIQAGRLPHDEYNKRFADAVPALSSNQALLESERCLYCFDAPCTIACPTSIDVPSFIKRIGEGNLRGAARTILESNPLGGTCARVCPTEILCESVCVRNTQESRPVAIGRLQRFAVDALMQSGNPRLFERAKPTGKTVAVVGAGPAGLACAHTLARKGHAVVIFDANSRPGGLNEYGLATYKMADNFAQTEIRWLLSIGGIEIRNNWKLERGSQLDTLRTSFDAVFLAVGLASTASLNIPGEGLSGVQNAVDFISALRQNRNLAALPVGKRVVVIGGGMTAVDAAVQSKLLGASSVHMVYRRGPEQMSASKAEIEWAQTNGVTIHHWLAPVEITGVEGHATGALFAEQHLQNSTLTPTGVNVNLEADVVLKAIGQTLGNKFLKDADVRLENGRIFTDENGRTNLNGVWAGGDCRAGGLELTVDAVEHGKLAANDIHKDLSVK